MCTRPGVVCDIQHHTLNAVRHSHHTQLHDAYTTLNKAPPNTLPSLLATLTTPLPGHGSHLSITHTYLACTTLYTYATTHMSQYQKSLATTSHTTLAITTRNHRTRGNSNSPMPKESTPKKKKSKSAAKAAKDMRSKLVSLVRVEEHSSEEEDYSPPVTLTAADEQHTPSPIA